MSSGHTDRNLFRPILTISRLAQSLARFRLKANPQIEFKALYSVTKWLDHLVKIWQFYNKEKCHKSKFLMPK